MINRQDLKIGQIIKANYLNYLIVSGPIVKIFFGPEERIYILTRHDSSNSKLHEKYLIEQEVIHTNISQRLQFNSLLLVVPTEILEIIT